LKRCTFNPLLFTKGLASGRPYGRRVRTPLPRHLRTPARFARPRSGVRGDHPSPLHLDAAPRLLRHARPWEARSLSRARMHMGTDPSHLPCLRMRATEASASLRHPHSNPQRCPSSSSRRLRSAAVHQSLAPLQHVLSRSTFKTSR
jgi:hypothetical protein